MAYRILLYPMDSETQAAVSAALPQVLNLSAGAAQKLVAATPIAILYDLSLSQATSILAECAPLLEAGAMLALDAGFDAHIPHVSWPQPPRINGRTLDSIGDIGAVEDIDIFIPDGGEAGDLDDTVEAEDIAAEALVEEVPATTATRPSLPPLPPTGSHAAVNTAPASLKSAPAAPDGEDDEDDEEEESLISGVGPLIDTQAFAPVFGEDHLKEFETGNHAPISDPEENDGKSDHTRRHPSVRTQAPGTAGPFTVAIASSQNEQAAKLTAKLLKVPPSDALARMKKPILTVAKGVSKERAQDIAKRYKAFGVKASVTRKP